jgi:hypothetical protein
MEQPAMTDKKKDDSKPSEFKKNPRPLREERSYNDSVESGRDIVKRKDRPMVSDTYKPPSKPPKKP